MSGQTAEAQPSFHAWLHARGGLSGKASPATSGVSAHTGQSKSGRRSYRAFRQTSFSSRQSTRTRSLPRHLHGHRFCGYVQRSPDSAISGPKGPFSPLSLPCCALETAIRTLASTSTGIHRPSHHLSPILAATSLSPFRYMLQLLTCTSCRGVMGDSTAKRCSATNRHEFPLWNGQSISC